MKRYLIFYSSQDEWFYYLLGMCNSLLLIYTLFFSTLLRKALKEFNYSVKLSAVTPPPYLF